VYALQYQTNECNGKDRPTPSQNPSPIAMRTQKHYWTSLLAYSCSMSRDNCELGALVRAHRLVETRFVEVASLLVGAALAIGPRLTDNDTRDIIVRVGWILHDLDFGQHTWDSAVAADRKDRARFEAALCSARARRGEAWSLAVLWSSDGEAVVVFCFPAAELEFGDRPFVLGCSICGWSGHGG
jgi:hypothetical protein